MSEAQARKQLDRPLFLNVAHEEVSALSDISTWVPFPRGIVPINAKVIHMNLIFERKRDTNGKFERHKAQKVAKEFQKVAWRDYTEKLAPVARRATLRTLMAIAAAKDLAMEQMDIKTALLNGTLRDELYVRQSQGL